MGVGDPFGMAITHALASGMGGIRTAGDLVARVQMSRGLKTEAAKEYVAGKLGIGVLDLANEEVMTEVRRELDLGLVYSLPGYARGLEAKRNIAGVFAFSELSPAIGQRNMGGQGRRCSEAPGVTAALRRGAWRTIREEFVGMNVVKGLGCVPLNPRPGAIHEATCGARRERAEIR